MTILCKSCGGSGYFGLGDRDFCPRCKGTGQIDELADLKARNDEMLAALKAVADRGGPLSTAITRAKARLWVADVRGLLQLQHAVDAAVAEEEDRA